MSALSDLAWCAYYTGRYEEAEEIAEEAVALGRAAGDEEALARALNARAALIYERGDPAAAEALLEEAIALLRRVGDLRNVAIGLGTLAEGAIGQGRLDRGREALAEALALAHESGDTGFVPYARVNLGVVDVLAGQTTSGERNLRESLSLLRELGDRRYALLALRGLAAAAAARGDRWRAASLLGAASAAHAALGTTRWPVETALDERGLLPARDALDEKAWEEAWAAGSTMSLDDAVETALGGAQEEPNP